MAVVRRTSTTSARSSDTTRLMTSLKKQVSFGTGEIVYVDTLPRENVDRTEFLEQDDKNSPETEDPSRSLFEIRIRAEYEPFNEPGMKVKFFRRLGGDEKIDVQHATDIKFAEEGHLLITDMIGSMVKMIEESGKTIRVYGADDIREPWSVAEVRGQKLAVTCKQSKSVIIMDKVTGYVTHTFGQRFFKSPRGLAADADGNVIVTDIESNRVSIHDVDSGRVISFVGENYNFKNPRYVTVSKQGNIIVNDSGNHCIKVFDKYGHFVRQFGKYGSGDGCLKFPHGVCSDRFDNIYVADHYNHRVSVFDQYGVFCCNVATATHGIEHPQGLTLSPDLELCVSVGDLKANTVLVYQLDVIEITKDGFPNLQL